MKLSRLLILILIVCGLGSCKDARKLSYLQGPLDPEKFAAVHYKEPVIQAGDILSITVYSDNPVATAIYNQGSISAATTGSASTSTTGGAAGYLVDGKGNIQFHSIGSIFVKGLTRAQLSDTIAQKLKVVLNNPYCIVRFNNFRITVLGEVKSPNVYTIPSEKISVLEILGLAGDLTNYARRDSILVVRETETERKFGWMDIRRTDIFESEFFYLHQNDVVVVQPTKNKQTSSGEVTMRFIALSASVISTIAIVFSVLNN